MPETPGQIKSFGHHSVEMCADRIHRRPAISAAWLLCAAFLLASLVTYFRGVGYYGSTRQVLFVGGGVLIQGLPLATRAKWYPHIQSRHAHQGTWTDLRISSNATVHRLGAVDSARIAAGDHLSSHHNAALAGGQEMSVIPNQPRVNRRGDHRCLPDCRSWSRAACEMGRLVMMSPSLIGLRQLMELQGWNFCTLGYRRRVALNVRP